MQDFAYSYGLVCLYVCVSVCYDATFVRTSWTLGKIKHVKNDVVDFRIRCRMVLFRKLYFVTLTYFSKVKNCSWDLSAVTDERPYKCDEWNTAQSSSLAWHNLTHNNKRPFKCDECEFKYDEGDICSKTNRQLTRQKRARHSKGQGQSEFDCEKFASRFTLHFSVCKWAISFPTDSPASHAALLRM